MLSQLQLYYHSLPEPQQSTLLYLRSVITNFHPEITEHFSYSTAFFKYRKKNLCYFSVRKKDLQAYIGFVNGKLLKHRALAVEGRTQIKVYYLDSYQDLDLAVILELLSAAVAAENS